MFRQPRNAKRASRACKVGQQGLERLDARVVPSASPALAGYTPPPPIYNPPKQTEVDFDEFGGAKDATQVDTSKKFNDAKDIGSVLSKNGIKDVDIDNYGNIKGGGIIYKLGNDINLDLSGKAKKDDGFLAVAVTEQKTKDGYSYSGDHKPSQKLSDELLFVEVQGKGKYDKPTEYVLVFSDKAEPGEKPVPPADVKKDLPSLDKVSKDDIMTVPEVTNGKGNKETETATFYLPQAKSDSGGYGGQNQQQVKFVFYSEGHVGKSYDH